MASLAVSKTVHGGSNPSSPAHIEKDAFQASFFICIEGFEPLSHLFFAVHQFSDKLCQEAVFVRK